MSIRGYRIEEIKYAESDSFNLWHDSITDDIISEGYPYLNDDGAGFIEISVTALKKLIKKYKDKEPDTCERLKKDIKTTEKLEEEYILYYCF